MTRAINKPRVGHFDFHALTRIASVAHEHRDRLASLIGWTRPTDVIG